MESSLEEELSGRVRRKAVGDRYGGSRLGSRLEGKNGEAGVCRQGRSNMEAEAGEEQEKGQ